MPRYLDRLTNDARIQFEAVCKSRETPDCESELIALARMLPAMDPTIASMVVANRFGEAEAPGVLDLLEEIRGEDDRLAEAVGEPGPHHFTDEEIAVEHQRQANMLDALGECRKGRERPVHPLREAALALAVRQIAGSAELPVMPRRPDAPDTETLKARMEKLRVQRESAK